MTEVGGLCENRFGGIGRVLESECWGSGRWVVTEEEQNQDQYRCQPHTAIHGKRGWQHFNYTHAVEITRNIFRRLEC